MAAILESLSRDHKNLASLLDIVDRQFSALERAGEIDWEIVGLILDYAQRYADQCHHPIEELIYQALSDRSLLLEEYVHALHAEHGTLASITDRLHDMVTRALAQEAEAFDETVQEARSFLASYRRHMRMEETVLFSTAAEALSDDDWQTLDAQMRALAEPAFANNVQDRFLALRDYIHRLERINMGDPAPEVI